MQSKAVGWQPIESAPRDGTPVLVWSEGAAYVAEWCAIWHPDNKKWCVPNADRRRDGDMRIVSDIGPDLEPDGSPSPWGRTGPTHWAPIPPRPEGVEVRCYGQTQSDSLSLMDLVKITA